MKYNKIYFVENFHGIQYFLSIVEPMERNLIVTSGNKHLKCFLDDVLPNQKRIVIPRIPCHRFFIMPFLLVLWRIKYSRIFPMKNQGDAFFFSKGNNLHFFSVFRSLQKKGCNLHFIDGSGGKFNEKLIQEESVLQKIYNSILGMCCGQEIVRYQCRAWTHFGLKNFPVPMQTEPLSWERIADKFGAPKEKEKNAILIVDGPIQDISGVDVAKTQANLLQYFSENVKKEIHLKPHISYERHSFSGTPFEKMIKILPKHIPAELVMLRYDDIYFFSSAACYGEGKATKTSLAKLLAFDDEDAKDAFWKLFSDYYGDKVLFAHIS